MAAPADEVELEMRLSEPTSTVRESLAQLDGDLIVLGAGGKMGPSLCHMARRASNDRRRIFAASRFTDLRLVSWLSERGIEVIRGDLLNRKFVATLPACPLAVYMVGMKFGTSDQPGLAWAMNTVVPAMVCEQFQRSRFVGFSTGNVYPPVPVATSPGSSEDDALGPIGEYATTCVGRERIFHHFSRAHQIPVTLLRLNYATELRYGVLVDIARQVWQRQPVSLAMGYVNVIWQADANAQALSALGLAESPPFVLNITGPEILRIRDVANRFGELFQLPVTFAGEESSTALLNNSQRAQRLFGQPRVSAGQLIEWIAAWISAGRPLWNKLTHFAVRDGRY
jgi:nucleoside-diphosphate-sugar epimerase